MCSTAFVIGRHIREPFTEGGGKITYLIAKALSELGIKTYLIKVNYSLPGDRFYAVRTFSNLSEGLNELELRIGTLSQDDVLHRAHGALASNLVELVASPLLTVKLLKRAKLADKDLCIFIGNSSKLGGFLAAQLCKLSMDKTVEVLLVYRREEISRYTTRIIQPRFVLITSRELLIRTNKMLGNITRKVVFSYPPIPPNELPTEPITRKLPILLYMGRVTNQRFPLHLLKQIIMSLKKTQKDTSLLIVSPPESVSIKWLRSAKELASRLNAQGRVSFVLKTLGSKEKSYILSKASIFVFPSEYVVAVEPPLTVIESLVYGQYLLTMGGSSTRELTYSGAGQLVKNFEEVDIEEQLDKSVKLSHEISKWAQEVFSLRRLRHTLRDVVFKERT